MYERNLASKGIRQPFLPMATRLSPEIVDRSCLLEPIHLVDSSRQFVGPSQACYLAGLFFPKTKHGNALAGLSTTPFLQVAVEKFFDVNVRDVAWRFGPLS